MEEINEYLERLTGQVLSLPEEKMKLDLLKRSFEMIEPDLIARILNTIYTRDGGRKGVREIKALFVDPRTFKEILGVKKFRLIYLSAMELGLERITPLFTDLAPRKSTTKQEVREEDGRSNYETLGQRRSMSKAGVKDTLDKLLLDTDPMIIENLLNNPRIVRGQVLKIANARPAVAGILSLISGHAKWGKDYGVRLALVMNPYSSPRIALALLEFLMKGDLKMAAADETLHGQVRQTALSILKGPGEIELDGNGNRNDSEAEEN